MVTAKFGFRYINAASASAISIPSAALLMLVATPWMFDPSQASTKGAITFALIGLFFPAAVTLLVFGGTDRLGATTANAISNTTPMFAILAAVLFLGEELTFARAFGALAVVIGIVTLSWDEKGQKRGWPIWALAFPLGAAVARGSGLALTKYGLEIWPDPFAAVLIGYCTSATVLLLLDTLRAWRSGRKPTVYSKAIPWFVLTGWCNGCATLLMYTALKRGEVSLVSPIVATSPLFTFIVGAVILRQERLSWRLAGGVVLAVAGILLLVVA